MTFVGPHGLFQLYFVCFSEKNLGKLCIWGSQFFSQIKRKMLRNLTTPLDNYFGALGLLSTLISLSSTASLLSPSRSFFLFSPEFSDLTDLCPDLLLIDHWALARIVRIYPKLMGLFVGLGNAFSTGSLGLDLSLSSLHWLWVWSRAALILSPSFFLSSLEIFELANFRLSYRSLADL